MPFSKTLRAYSRLRIRSGVMAVRVRLADVERAAVRSTDVDLAEVRPADGVRLSVTHQ